MNTNATEEIIKRFEGFRAKPYVCQGGKKTVGYGHTNGEIKSKSITKKEAEQFLKKDIADTQAAIARNIKVPLTHNQLAALTSFTYNLGAAALQRSTLRRCINRGDHEQAAKEFLRWDKVNGRRIKGLTLRRQYESYLYSSDDDLLLVPVSN